MRERNDEAKWKIIELKWQREDEECGKTNALYQTRQMRWKSSCKVNEKGNEIVLHSNIVYLKLNGGTRNDGAEKRLRRL